MKIKNLNKKGFTLIELLAVIVILAIILVIAVPNVLNIQKKSQKNVTKDGALILVKAIELCISSESMTGNQAACASDGAKIGDYYNGASDSSGTTYTYNLAANENGDVTISNFTYASNGFKIETLSGTTYNNVDKLKSAINNLRDDEIKKK